MRDKNGKELAVLREQYAENQQIPKKEVKEARKEARALLEWEVHKFVLGKDQYSFEVVLKIDNFLYIEFYNNKSNTGIIIVPVV